MRDNTKEIIGIYIHVPFCVRKCPYCDFYSVKKDDRLMTLYVEAVCRNIKNYFGYLKPIVDTIYFGGGTPSLLEPKDIDMILSMISKRCFITKDCEVTMEANPCTVDRYKLKAYRNIGVNRLSFGIQSADDNELRLLGRLHDFNTARRAVENAYCSGFENISADIMSALPGQTMEKFEYSLERISSLPINHISAYMLKIEKGTPFDCSKIRNMMIDDDLSADMYLETVKFLYNRGFKQYEISNFAKNGAVSRHNLKYWTGGDYVGIGPSAHSLFHGRRTFCENDLMKFLYDRNQTNIIEDENRDVSEEYLMLNLRLTDGVKFDDIYRNFGDEKGEKIIEKSKFFEKNGLCISDYDGFHLTPQGFLVSNEIISELIYC